MSYTHTLLKLHCTIKVFYCQWKTSRQCGFRISSFLRETNNVFELAVKVWAWPFLIKSFLYIFKDDSQQLDVMWNHIYFFLKIFFFSKFQLKLTFEYLFILTVISFPVLIFLDKKLKYIFFFITYTFIAKPVLTQI